MSGAHHFYFVFFSGAEHIISVLKEKDQKIYFKSINVELKLTGWIGEIYCYKRQWQTSHISDLLTNIDYLLDKLSLFALNGLGCPIIISH